MQGDKVVCKCGNDAFEVVKIPIGYGEMTIDLRCIKCREYTRKVV